MNTLDKEQELIDILVNAIDQNTNDNVMVISAKNYGDKRKDNMVVVGISNSTPVHAENPMLPDYEYIVDVLVDCFIAEDKEGFQYQKTKNEVLKFLETYFRNQGLLPELFNDFPVVAMFYNGLTNATSDTSNQTRISMRVIASFDENL